MDDGLIILAQSIQNLWIMFIVFYVGISVVVMYLAFLVQNMQRKIKKLEALKDLTKKGDA